MEFLCGQYKGQLVERVLLSAPDYIAGVVLASRAGGLMGGELKVYVRYRIEAFDKRPLVAPSVSLGELARYGAVEISTVHTYEQAVAFARARHRSSIDRRGHLAARLIAYLASRKGLAVDATDAALLAFFRSPTGHLAH